MYAVLGVLCARALQGREWSWVLLVVGLIVLFAAGDEWHQRWIPGRGADVSDWAADVAGGIIGLSLYRARRRQELAR